LIHDWN
jgi:hypothetical protein